jgi:DNA-binding FrmR family transcriptional regulator
VSLSMLEKTTLLHEIRRIEAQFAGLERAIERETSCRELLESIAVTRGAIDSFLMTVMEKHIKSNFKYDHEKRAAARS